MSPSIEKIRLGISTCLLGERVRYDGGHKRDAFLADTLSRYVEWVPVCPEVECGLPVPREAMHLAGDADSPHLLTIQTKIDHTDRMLAWAARRVRELEREGLCGFVFKSKSPSSGMERVKLYDAHGNSRKVAVGLFARAFMEHFPLLPVEEDGRLHDPVLRENFIERIFCLKRYRDMVAAGGGRRRLVDFQADHKLLLLSHSAELMRRMGHLVGRAKEFKPSDLFAQYERLMLQALKLTATVSKHVNALQHMMGHLRECLSADEKRELLDVLGQYKSGLVPLVVPITLLQHHARKHQVEYLLRQVYLHPHPLELKLRNHA
ncbi:MAG: DUF523 and DUF1722 domain-containing protein [Planctomycetes bacterium]|nr:DUF523 and DUF1722 domain-containing protein [Planctomycetota bacterium]